MASVFLCVTGQLPRVAGLLAVIKSGFGRKSFINFLLEAYNWIQGKQEGPHKQATQPDRRHAKFVTFFDLVKLLEPKLTSKTNVISGCSTVCWKYVLCLPTRIGICLVG